MAVTYEDVRGWGLALPEAEEVWVEAWGHATLRVRGKIFVLGQGEDNATVSLKLSPEDQRALIAEAPGVYAVAPYVGRYGWVRVDLAKADPGELRELVEDAWRRTAPKRVVTAFDAGK